MLPASLLVLERGWLSSNNIVCLEGEQAALIDSGYVTHAAQTAPNSGWELLGSLGGDFSSDPAFSLNLDGRIEIFARDRSGNLLHDWQGAPNAPFDGWNDLGPVGSF